MAARGMAEAQLQLPGSLVQWLVQLLSDRIIEGSYREGERLPETQLAVELGVSRAPIREAFRVLEREGLIVLSPRRGAVVASFDAKVIDEIYQCRVVLIALAVELAAPRLTRQDFAQLRRLLAKMEAAVAAGDIVQYFHFNVQFNDLVRDKGGNEVLQQLIRTLGKRVTRLRFRSMSLPSRAEASFEGNRRTLEALEAGDAKEAGRRAGEVIEGARLALIENIKGKSAHEASARRHEARSL
ncbi:MAG: GntR family transcriptional regulator [Chloroflexota bacterium]|nr:GntR family transcriptional regulator [Chloroflexota bacterium]